MSVTSYSSQTNQFTMTGRIPAVNTVLTCIDNSGRTAWRSVPAGPPGSGTNVWEWSTYLVSPDFSQFNMYDNPPPVATYTDIQAAIDAAAADYVAAADGRRRLVLIRPGVYVAAGGAIQLKRGVDLMGAENSLTANDAASLTQRLPVQIRGELQLNIAGAASDPPSLIANLSWVAPAGENALVTLAGNTVALNCTNCTFTGDSGPGAVTVVYLASGSNKGASFQNCIFYTDNVVTASYSLETFAGNPVTLVNCQLNRGAAFRAAASVISTLVSCTALGAWQNYGPGLVSLKSCELYSVHIQNMPPLGLTTTINDCTVYESQITGNGILTVNNSTFLLSRSFVIPSGSLMQFTNCKLNFEPAYSIQVTDGDLIVQNTVCEFEDSDECVEALRSNVTVDNSVISFLSNQIPVSRKAIIFVLFEETIPSSVKINNSKLSFFLENSFGQNYTIFLQPGVGSTSFLNLQTRNSIFLRGDIFVTTKGTIDMNESNLKEAGLQILSKTRTSIKNCSGERDCSIALVDGRNEISNSTFDGLFVCNSAPDVSTQTPYTIVTCCHFGGANATCVFSPDPTKTAVQKIILSNCSFSGNLIIDSTDNATNTNCLIRVCSCSIGNEQITAQNPLFIANHNSTDKLFTLETYGNSIFSQTSTLPFIDAAFSTTPNSTLLWKSQSNFFFGKPYNSLNIVTPSNADSGVQ